MSELSKGLENIKLYSRDKLKIIIRQRIDEMPEHLKGREVSRIAKEMNVSKRRVYQIIREAEFTKGQ